MPLTPDYTPIEQAFSNIKAILRGLGTRTRKMLLEAVCQAVAAITAEDAAGWFAHTGYPLPAPPSCELLLSCVGVAACYGW